MPDDNNPLGFPVPRPWHADVVCQGLPPGPSCPWAPPCEPTLEQSASPLAPSEHPPLDEIRPNFMKEYASFLYCPDCLA